MRVVSQDGMSDVPYENSCLDIVCLEPKRTAIYFKNIHFDVSIRLAGYSTKEKAIKAMEMLRETYVGMPIVMQNIDISEDLAKEFERLKKCGVMVRAENQPSKVEYINNAIFQFPKDDDIEV
jgi:hypothetical protein